MYCLADWAACVKSSPRAMAAAKAEDRVQPVPCVLRVFTRLEGSRATLQSSAL